MPLLGFAIRQRALPDGGQIDCEYAGYFQSGVTAGPFRNGAPCRSPRENDPLEGMQVRIALRPPRARAEGCRLPQSGLRSPATPQQADRDPQLASAGDISGQYHP
jgi:hypothetical protein